MHIEHIIHKPYTYAIEHNGNQIVVRPIVSPTEFKIQGGKRWVFKPERNRLREEVAQRAGGNEFQISGAA